jgi:hypothetical protein
MSDPPREALARECRVFTSYLAGREATPYICRSFEQGHARIPYRHAAGPDAIDTLLIRAALIGGPATRVADMYARIFRPTGALRQKLVLLCAVLENSPETHAWFNSADAENSARVIGRLVLAGLASGLALLAGLVLLGPLHLVARLAAGGGAGGGQA